MEAPSRLNAPPQKTRARVLEKMKDITGRSEIVRRHFCELFTDTADEVLPEWIDQRWPREILEALPRIDAERVREITWTLRKRTSCADDHAHRAGNEHMGENCTVFSSSDCLTIGQMMRMKFGKHR